MSGAGAGMPDGPDPRREGDAGAAAVSSPPERLKLRPDFVRASGGGRVHSRSLSLQIYRRVDDGMPVEGCRVGLTVTKKVGNAVERNRVKRRFREALRAPSLATRPDHDYVIVARREALSAPFTSLVGELRRCLADAASGRSKKGRSRGQAGAGPRRGKGDTSPTAACEARTSPVSSK